MYATLQLKGTKGRKKEAAPTWMISRWEIPPQWSSSPARRAAGSGLTGKPNWFFISFLGARNFIGLVGFGALDVDQLVYSPGKIRGAVPLSELPRSLFLLGSSGLSELPSQKFIWDCHLCHSLRLPSLLFFEIVFVILLRVNFSGVKEDKCGEVISTVKLTTCRSPMRRIKNNYKTLLDDNNRQTN